MLRKLSETENTDALSFGQYANVPLEDVPTHYLQWVYDNVEVKWNYSEAMQQAVEDELCKR